MITFSVVNEAVSGSILTGDGKYFQLRNADEGGFVVEDIDPSGAYETPRDTAEGCQAPAPQKLSPACQTDGHNEIDVLVIYTNIVGEVFKDNPDFLKSKINNAIEQTNRAFRDSGIDLKLRLAHEPMKIQFDENGSTKANRDRLQERTDVRQLRDQFGADLVVMLTQNGDHVGYSFPMYCPNINFREDLAFAVVKQGAADSAGTFAFAHEIGHLLGAAHEWDAWSAEHESSLYMQNHAYVQPSPTTPGVMAWRTVTGGSSCSQCGAILRYSNPDISYQGEPTGVRTGDKPAHNSSVIKLSACTIANFRCKIL